MWLHPLFFSMKAVQRGHAFVLFCNHSSVALFA
jgi:hypothetical protein